METSASNQTKTPDKLVPEPRKQPIEGIPEPRTEDQAILALKMDERIFSSLEISDEQLDEAKKLLEAYFSGSLEVANANDLLAQVLGKIATIDYKEAKALVDENVEALQPLIADDGSYNSVEFRELIFTPVKASGQMDDSELLNFLKSYAKRTSGNLKATAFQEKTKTTRDAYLIAIMGIARELGYYS